MCFERQRKTTTNWEASRSTTQPTLNFYFEILPQRHEEIREHSNTVTQIIFDPGTFQREESASILLSEPARQDNEDSKGKSKTVPGIN
jgi:hypothetical protein